ncbi:MAG: helix-turn-helix transcriptional regulator [Clostridia bacterium]|nr:helix-turn-helix transcriptional regulator [Clostridia bacterium]
MNNLIPRGQISTILLSCLLDGDKYGAELLNDLHKKSDNQVSVKQPTLYGTLARMEKQGFISSYWKDSKNGGKRHYYKITDSGKKYLEDQENSVLANFSVDSQNEAKKYYEIGDFEKNNDKLFTEKNQEQKKAQNFDSETFLNTLQKEEKLSTRDGGIFLPKQKTTEKKYYENEGFEEQSNTDGGVFITETLPKEQIRKVKKLGSVNLEIEPTGELVQKLRVPKRKETDADKIEALYNEMNKSTNFVKLGDADDDEFVSVSQLQERYDDMQIKFSAKIEDNEEIENSFGKVPTKHLFAKYFTIFSLIFASSLAIYLIFTNLYGSVEYPIAYLIMPIIFAIPALYYLITKNKFRKIHSSNSNLFVSISIFLVGVVAVFSLNLLLNNDFSFATCLGFATTFLYPCVLLFNFVVGGIFDYIFAKKFCD